ncbi:hypothetical protein [Embleya sp. NPDC005971]|uniref:hypothetical protein n=1 Tax=Embleya sp. NPDC005971 TaxID=3156724 RepID=UPI0033CD9701
MTDVTNGVRDTLRDAPEWSLVVGGALLTAVVLVLVYRIVTGIRTRQRERRREEQALALEIALATGEQAPTTPTGFGAQVVPALGGVSVSVYGLWGVASEQVGLPLVLCVGFIGVFDAAEVTLFWLLHRGAVARAGLGWSAQLRRMQQLTWTLVAFSAGMNAWHADSMGAAIILAAIPVLSARLIALQLASILYADGSKATDTGRPGPFKLLELGWRTFWAWLFTRLSLDARAGAEGEIERAQLASRAALLIYRLRVVLLAQEKAEADQSRGTARKRAALAKDVERSIARAERAMDLADVGPDRDQTIAVFQRVAARVRLPELALQPYERPAELERIADELQITTAVERARTDVALSDAERLRAETYEEREQVARLAVIARERLESAVAELGDLKQAAADARQAAEQAAAEQTDAERAREDAERARDHAVAEMSTAGETAATTEAERARLAAELGDLKQAAADARQAAEQAAAVQTDAERAREDAERARDHAAAELREVERVAQDARQERARLAAELGDLEQTAADARQAAERADAEQARLRELEARGAVVTRHEREAAAELERIRTAAEQAQVERAEAVRERREADERRRRSENAVEQLGAELEALRERREADERAAEQARAQREAAEREAREQAEQARAARREAAELAALLGHLREDVGEVVDASGRREITWQSEEKTLGWEYYVSELDAGRVEPTAAELAAFAGRSPRSGSDWLKHFREARARQLAARRESSGAPAVAPPPPGEGLPVDLPQPPESANASPNSPAEHGPAASGELVIARQRAGS